MRVTEKVTTSSLVDANGGTLEISDVQFRRVYLGSYPLLTINHANRQFVTRIENSEGE